MATQQEKQFFTTKPREIYFETIELYHSQIGTLRYVFKQFFDKEFTLESDAPRDAGNAVSFSPAAGEVSPLIQSDSPTTSLEINLGRVGQNVKNRLSNINGTGWIEQIECIYRVYDGSDTSEPLNVPPRLFISNISMTRDNVSIDGAEDDNPLGVTVARKYLAQDFPGLEFR